MRTLILCIVVAVGSCFPLRVDGQTTFTGKTMGPIEYNVVVYGEMDDRDEVQAGIQGRLDQINSLMSTYIDSSDVSRVNDAEANVWVPVDPLTVKVVSKSLEFSELTGGAFDITVGPAVGFWKFGAESKSKADDVSVLREFVGYANVECRDSPSAIRKKDARTKIDLSAIAKGYAVDRVAEWMRAQGYEHFMVEVGGEVLASGKTENGRWRIGIEQPLEMRRAIASVAELTDMAMATSGDYRNFRIENGKRISHTIDPTTCEPVENDLASCSIVVDDCLTADAIATAVMVMGSEKGIEFCRTQGFEYAVIRRVDSNESGFEMEMSNSFPSRINPKVAAGDDVSIWPAFVGALVVFSLAVAGMAVGAVFNNKPIAGSCGGIAATKNEDGSSSCSMCQKPVTECPENNSEKSTVEV